MQGDADLVTGATGFVGAALVLELLRRGSGSIVALVRPGRESAAERLSRALTAAAVAYGAPELVGAIERRCVAVEGDVTRPGCGAPALPSRRYQRFWHSAASLAFEDRYAAEIRAVNVDGTQNALALAARAGVVEAFNYVSTAYVAGAREGLVGAAAVVDARPNNLYEASKIEAEAAVAAERRFYARILRPSIVIGHSETLAATTFSGMYGFLRRLYTFRRLMDRTERGLLAARPLRICGDPAAPLDLVTIDQVAGELAGIGLSGAQGAGGCSYFHVNQARPPTVGEVIGGMAEALEMAPPRWVEDASELEWIDEKFNDRIDFYRSYLRGRKRFDRAGTDVLVGAPARSMAVDLPGLRRHYGWYLARLEAERAGIPSSR
jgi:nucleoside-diphosphate-sugar epimerase